MCAKWCAKIVDLVAQGPCALSCLDSCHPSLLHQFETRMVGIMLRGPSATRLQHRNSADYMVSTFASWGPFLCPHFSWGSSWDQAQHWRLLCQLWKKSWNSKVKVVFNIEFDHLRKFEHLGYVYEGLLRHGEHMVVFHSATWEINHPQAYKPVIEHYQATMSWNAAMHAMCEIFYDLFDGSHYIEYHFIDVFFHWQGDGPFLGTRRSR